MSSKRSRAAFESDGPPHHAPFALYGTPLPAYDADARDDGSYVPIWKQEVTDERGRKRLHGAFTGGFSAGYFNTVGSKEGWAPSAFVSSRSKRAGKDEGQRVEDFMDEEDLAARAESQTLETQGGFAGLGSSAGGGGDGKAGMFSDLFRTTGETMGVKLLQRMGWRQGQGVGPKVRRRAQGDAKGEVYLFAPENSRLIGFERKTDRKGLGFAGEGRLEPGKDADEDDDGSEQDAKILQNQRSKVLSKPKQKMKKATGFGVGVLNDTGSDDDENEYDMGPKLSYNRVIGGDKKSKKKGGLTASTSTVQKPVFTPASKKLGQRTAALSAGFRKCHDGRLPLEGFILTLTPLALTSENLHPPPTVPEGWTPSTKQSNNDNTTPSYQSTSTAAKASTHDPKSRAALLGETPLPTKSIFAYLTPAARDRIAAATNNPNLPAAGNEKASSTPAQKRKTLWDLVPELDAQTAAEALRRWMPYAEDEGKRSRYRDFLSLRAGITKDLPSRVQGVSVDEWARELREFAQAAEVFKPVSGLMAARFTSSSSAAPAAETEEDPAMKAAKVGMYGPHLTRSRQPFYPTRLLCKRFNVKPPANTGVDPGEDGAGSAEGGGNKLLDVVSQASLDRMMREASFAPRQGTGFVSGGVEGGEEASVPPARQKREEIDVEKNEALEGEKAGEAIFKAIFGSDDEDDE